MATRSSPQRTPKGNHPVHRHVSPGQATVFLVLYRPVELEVGRGMRTNTLALIVLFCGLVGCTTRGTSQEAQLKKTDHSVGQLLTSVIEDDLEVRRQAAADLCIAMLKRNGVWRVEPLNWKILTEEEIRMAVGGVRSSKQERELALANMCAHCMGMLKSGAWRTAPIDEEDPLEENLVSVVRATDDPVVKIMILVGLASSPTTRARDAVVAATSDAVLGVRKSANYLVQRGTANYFGPIGVIHIGSPAGDVDASGQKIRAIYRWDKTVGAGWGPMEDGLQTRLVIQPTAPPVGATIAGSLVVRNVSEVRKKVVSSVHPVQHVRILHNKKYVWPKVEPVPRPPAGMTLAPGEQKTLWSFTLNDFIKTSSPGKYEIWLRDTDGWLPPQSNRVHKLE